MDKKQKEDLRKAAALIRKLEDHKLQMNYVACTNAVIPSGGGESYKLYSDDPKYMKLEECDGAGCVMGWMPRMFPRKFKYVPDTSTAPGAGRLWVQLRGTNLQNQDAMEEFFGIETGDADVLFGPEQENHTTPEEVATNLEFYAENECLPEYL